MASASARRKEQAPMRLSSATKQHDHSHAQTRFAVIPTPLRLGADSEYTGKGVTIAFLDSGFYPHPDLIQPENRIVAFKDITITKSDERFQARTHPQALTAHHSRPRLQHPSSRRCLRPIRT